MSLYFNIFIHSFISIRSHDLYEKYTIYLYVIDDVVYSRALFLTCLLFTRNVKILVLFDINDSLFLFDAFFLFIFMLFCYHTWHNKLDYGVTCIDRGNLFVCDCGPDKGENESGSGCGAGRQSENVK